MAPKPLVLVILCLTNVVLVKSDPTPPGLDYRDVSYENLLDLKQFFDTGVGNFSQLLFDSQHHQLIAGSFKILMCIFFFFFFTFVSLLCQRFQDLNFKIFRFIYSWHLKLAERRPLGSEIKYWFNSQIRFRESLLLNIQKSTHRKEKLIYKC